MGGYLVASVAACAAPERTLCRDELVGLRYAAADRRRIGAAMSVCALGKAAGDRLHRQTGLLPVQRS